MIKPIALTAILLSLNCVAAAAPFVSLKAGTDWWKSELNNTHTSPPTVSDSTKFSGSVRPQYFIALEHSLPLIPNVRLDYGKIKQVQSSSSQVDQENIGSFKFDTLRQESTRAILYYDLFIPFVDVELGLGAQKLAIELQQPLPYDSSVVFKENKTTAIAFLGLETPMIFESFTLRTDVFFSKDSSFEERSWQALVRYHQFFLPTLGLDFGYRNKQIKLGQSIDYETKGIFSGINFSF